MFQHARLTRIVGQETLRVVSKHVASGADREIARWLGALVVRGQNLGGASAVDLCRNNRQPKHPTCRAEFPKGQTCLTSPSLLPRRVTSNQSRFSVAPSSVKRHSGDGYLLLKPNTRRASKCCAFLNRNQNCAWRSRRRPALKIEPEGQTIDSECLSARKAHHLLGELARGSYTNSARQAAASVSCERSTSTTAQSRDVSAFSGLCD